MRKLIQKLINFLQLHKILASVGIITLIIGLIIGISKIRSIMAGPETKYETVKVKKQDISQTISASGMVQAENQTTLKFQTSGELVWVGVKEGDKVRKWQAIASLDIREIEKNIKKKLLAYMKERWDFEQTHEDYEVEGRPLEKASLTDAEKRILEKAQFDLDSSVLDVEIYDLSKKLATIHSPIDGIVTEIESPIAGVNITPATATFTIADPSEMKFVANVDESDIGEVRIGQKVMITLDAYPDQNFEGEVEKIAFASITTRGGGTAFPVDITLPENIDQRFKVGMNGDAEIILASHKEVLTVPLESIKRKKDKIYVEIIGEGKIKEVEVKLGIESETDVEIIEGLTEGQIVITGEKKK